MTLRGRLMAALVATAALPILAFSWTLHERIARLAELQLQQRLAVTASAMRGRLESSRARLLPALERVRAAVNANGAASLSPAAWSALAESNALDVLEAVGPDGKVLASHHWPAGYALPDDDRVLDDALGVRVQKLAAGHGFVERLSLTAETEARSQAQPIRIRGGSVLDESWFDEWGRAAGAQLALVAATPSERFTGTSSALARGALFGIERGNADGVFESDGIRLRWAAQRIGPRLSAVAAAPATAPDSALAGELMRLSFAFAGLAALLGIAAALVLSAGIVGPLERLSRASQRVAAGGLSEGVPAEGAPEIAELGRSLNEMLEDLRKAQLRLVQAGRVEVWRDLARRLAHELKNPLFPIQISVETLQRAYQKEQPAATSPEFQKRFEELTATLLAELESLRRIVEGFAGFARMPEPRLQPTDLNALLARVLDLHAARAGETLRIERRLAPDLPRVPADPDLLSRALANLVRNALEAMPDGGTLTLATRALPGHAEIAIADTGPGVDTRQLFQPYHTTKPGGTGLGLVIVQSIVSDHRGELDVESAPGAGTTFRLRLPLGGAA